MRPAALRISAVFLAALGAAAAPGRPGPAVPESCPAIDPPSSVQAVRAFVDPATGRLRPPTAEERSRPSLAVRDRSARNYVVVVRPDGTRLVELDDAFSMSVVATRQPGAGIQFRCVAGAPSGGPEK